MTRKEFLPIILGSDENAYGTARQLQEVPGAARPLLVCTLQLNATRDSSLFDVRVVPELDHEDVFPDALLTILREMEPSYPGGIIVIPCSDYYTDLMCRYYDHFEGRIRNRFNPPGLLETFSTKDRFYNLCRQYGLDYPQTVVCDLSRRMEIVDDLPFPFPIVVKPENSNATNYLHCKFEGVKKVYFFNRREEYLDIAKKLTDAGYKGKMIIQEFIPGDDSAMRVINCYSGHDGKVRAMSLGQPVLEFYDPPSIGNYAAIISRRDQTLYDKIQRFLEELGYVGFSNFDMKYDSRTGRYVLFEINPRLGRSSFFTYCAGMNLVAELCVDVIDGTTHPCLYGDRTVLWSHVPKGILLRYVSDPALRQEVKRLPIHYTLRWSGDKNWKRTYRHLRYALGQYRSFRRYFFDKSGPFTQR